METQIGKQQQWIVRNGREMGGIYPAVWIEIMNKVVNLGGQMKDNRGSKLQMLRAAGKLLFL